MPRSRHPFKALLTLPPFIAWHVPYITDEDRHSLLEQYQTYLTNLDQLDPLIFPRLEEFDEKMMPKK
jgi:NAD(P)H dehydrogenase (quinone)